MSLQSVQHHVMYNAEHKVLMCKEHKYGITNIARHFQELHNDMSTKTRLKIRVSTQHLELTEPDNIVIPSSNDSPIEGLKLVEDGAKCNECGHITGTTDSMKYHCRHEHDWKAKDEPQWTKQAVQTFYPGTIYCTYDLILGKYRKFFAVTLPMSRENQTISTGRCVWWRSKT